MWKGIGLLKTVLLHPGGPDEEAALQFKECWRFQ